MSQNNHILSADEIARAGWESTTVQNLDPMLSVSASKTLWEAIVALRSEQDVEAFAISARTLGASQSPAVREAIERAIANLVAITTAAAPAAKE